MSIITSNIPQTGAKPPVQATPTKTASGTTAAGGQTQLDKTYNEFLKLLLTQLKNQDPTSPVDTAQFTQQLVSLSQVQQGVNTNSNLEKLIGVSQGSQINNAVGYIGKEVESEGSASVLFNGNAEFSYSLPSEASKVKITISDAAGQTVYQGNGSTKTGKNIVVWDGTNSTTGKTMPDGSYTIKVDATDSSSKVLAATTYSTGLVTSVNLTNGSVMLALGNGGSQLALDKILSIRNPAYVVGNVGS